MACLLQNEPAMMAFVTVEDLFGSVECVCFPKVYDRVRDLLVADKVVSLSGKISMSDGKAPSIVIDKMTEFNVDSVPEQKEPVSVNSEYGVGATGVSAPQEVKNQRLWLNVSELEDEDIEELLETLTYYSGQTEVFFVKDGKKMKCSQKVSPDNRLMAELMTFMSEKCIKLI